VGEAREWARASPRDHSWNAPLGEPGNVVLVVVTGSVVLVVAGAGSVVLVVDAPGTVLVVDGETPHAVWHDANASRQS
jgi:hypothetical protein